MTDRVTYATLAAGQTEEFQRHYDAALGEVRGQFGWSTGIASTGRRRGRTRPRSRTAARSTPAW